MIAHLRNLHKDVEKINPRLMKIYLHNLVKTHIKITVLFLFFVIIKCQ